MKWIFSFALLFSWVPTFGNLYPFEEELQKKIEHTNPQIVALAHNEIENFLHALDAAKTSSEDPSTLAWKLFFPFIKTCHLLNVPDAPRNQILHTKGVVRGHLHSTVFQSRLTALIAASREIPCYPEDHASNYRPYVEQHSTHYLLIEDGLKSMLTMLLEQLKDPIYKALGTPWRVVNVRISKSGDLFPEEHFPALKLYFYPHGAHHVKTGTYFLSNSSHIPQTTAHPVIEITLLPALEFDLEPHCAGLNAFLPELPWQKLSSFSDQPLFSHSILPLQPLVEPLIYCQTLHHYHSAAVANVLSQIHRSLQPEGDFIIKMPDFDQILQSWRSDESCFFECDMDSVTWLWSNFELADSIHTRAAMQFCAYYNSSFPHIENWAFHYEDPMPYFGPPLMQIQDLQQLSTLTPSQISQALATYVRAHEGDYHFTQQSAWSREELTQLLASFGFEVVTFDSNTILDTFPQLEGINDNAPRSCYCWARKR